jgi:hypothetical protein
MKTRDLEKKLIEEGYSLISSSGNKKWAKGSHVVMVVLKREMNKMIALRILKEINKYKSVNQAA